jgi:hypothetical protein
MNKSINIYKKKLKRRIGAAMSAAYGVQSSKSIISPKI